MLWTLIESFFYVNANWMDFYGDMTEELPPNMPELAVGTSKCTNHMVFAKAKCSQGSYIWLFVALQIWEEMIVAL
jgi:hypothetical protein